LVDDGGFRRERRSVYRRPQNGDVKRCQVCGCKSEFNERYSFEGTLVPAWVCDMPNCRPQILRAAKVFAAADSRDVTRAARIVQASARRTAMKSRAAVDRSRQRLAKSDVKLRRKG
jgi:hypothetical protein